MKNVLLVSLLLLVQTAFGQDTYYKSSIITLKNDTIKGFISNLYDAKSFKFKKKQTDKPTIYTPQQLKGVILDGNVFESRIVNLAYYATQSIEIADVAKGLQKDLERGRLVDTVFLHKLIGGTVNLYKMANKEGFVYYFAERFDILKEIPPLYYTIELDTNLAKSKELRERNNTYYSFNSMPRYLYQKYDYLDTLAYFLNDKTFYTTKSKFKRSEKTLIFFISQFNKKNDVPNGGILKSRVSSKLFWGANLGIIDLKADDDITDSKATNSVVFKVYALYPLIGINRNVFAKVGFNYFNYQNPDFNKSITSASLGLRYSMLSGFMRPYVEGSISAARLSKNREFVHLGFPLLLEGGVNIPIKNAFITLGANFTPIWGAQLNGYKFWAFHAGLMF
jgi:hypothetical protein